MRLTRVLYISLCLSLTAPGSIELYSQSYNPFGSYRINDTISLILRRDNSFEVYRNILNNSVKEVAGHQTSIDYNSLQTGSFSWTDSVVSLHSNNHIEKCRQELLVIDIDRLKNSKGCCFSFDEDTFYVEVKHSLKHKSIPEYAGTWENGKKVDWWSYYEFFDSKLRITKVLYHNGIARDTIIIEE
ncbi:MAG: hypothetical protein GF411_10820 [Candidatus Lokiarchaeota archaeon]|nr:hypothetical protein [Candidatus Lokiarchaeota archaeon]